MADIYNSASNTLLSGTRDDDSIDNYGDEVSINAGNGDDYIYNSGDSVTIEAGAGNDSIDNDGENVSIDGGAGNDYIDNYVGTSNADIAFDSAYEGAVVTLSGGAGDDTINNDGGSSLVSIDAGAGNDSIDNGGDKVSIDAGAGNDSIENNCGAEVSINAGAGNDSIWNDGDSVTIAAGAGNDDIYSYGDNVSINGGADDDYIHNYWGDSVTINGGAGDDSIELGSYWGGNTLKGGEGADVFFYHEGDLEEYYDYEPEDDEISNDILADYEEADTIYFPYYTTINKISTNSSGSVIFTVGEYNHKLVVKNAADKVVTYIDSDGTTKTFGGSTDSKLITLTEGNDTYSNTIDGATINALGGNDSIENYGAEVSINAGAGNDYIYNSGDSVTIDAGAGNDTIYNWSSGNNVSIDAGNGDDRIENTGSNVTINAGAGNDYIYNYWGGSRVTIDAGTGNDTLYTVSDGSKTLTGGAGSDIFIFYYDSDRYYGTDTITDYEEADTIQFNNVAVSKISTTSAGSVIFMAGDNKLVVKNAADKIITYIDADGTTKTFGGSSADEWQLDGTTATYGSLTVKGVKSLDGLKLSGKTLTISKASLGTKKVTVSDGYTLALGSDVSSSTTKKSWSLSKTTATYKQTTTAGYSLADNAITYTEKSSKTLATVKGVKSLDGLKLSGKVVTVSAASLGTSKVTVSDGYTLKLGSDVSSASTKKAWSLSKTTATYKQTTTAGYSLDDNAITYTEKDSATLATVKGATSKSGLKVSGKTIKLSTSALSKKVTVSGAYTFDFADDYSKATIIGSSSADTIVARGKKISVKGGAGNDTLKLLGTGTVAGGAGADVFALKSTAANVISDYAAEDKISLTSGTADFSVKGDDLLLNDKVTLTGAAALKVTYIEGGVEKIYTKPAEDTEAVKLNGAGTGVTLTVHYNDDTFDAADYAGSLVTIKASDVLHTLTITGNKNANKIVGTGEEDYIDGLAGSDTISGGKGDDTLIGGAGSDSLNGGAGEDSLLGGDKGDILLGGAGNDTLWGNKGDDTLTGGDGDDIFIYEDGDGKDIINDYLSVDKVIVLSGKVESPSVDVDGNVIFKVGNGQITFPNSANKYIELLDEYGNIRGGGVYKPPTTK